LVTALLTARGFSAFAFAFEVAVEDRPSVMNELLKLAIHIVSLAAIHDAPCSVLYSIPLPITHACLQSSQPSLYDSSQNHMKTRF
jgi:hypothetical protein